MGMYVRPRQSDKNTGVQGPRGSVRALKYQSNNLKRYGWMSSGIVTQHVLDLEPPGRRLWHIGDPWAHI